MPVYAPAALPKGEPEEFYEGRANWRLSEQLRRVVDAEGPLPDTVLFKRVARAWGLERTGSRIVERLRGLVPAEVRRTREGDLAFYWPTGVDPKSCEQFRVADESREDSRRHIADVCLEEAGAMVKYLLHHTGSTTRSDLAKSICRLIGMNRTPADAEARVGLAVDRLLQLGALAEVDGTVRLS